MLLSVDAKTLAKPLLMEGPGRVWEQEIKQGLVLVGFEVFELGRGGMGWSKADMALSWYSLRESPQERENFAEEER